MTRAAIVSETGGRRRTSAARRPPWRPLRAKRLRLQMPEIAAAIEGGERRRRLEDPRDLLTHRSPTARTPARPATVARAASAKRVVEEERETGTGTEPSSAGTATASGATESAAKATVGTRSGGKAVQVARGTTGET